MSGENAARSLRVLLLGFGHVGRRLLEILGPERKRHTGLASLRISWVGVATKNHGSVVDPAGIDPAALLDHWGRHRSLYGLPGGTATCRSEELARDLDYDVLVDLTPLSIAGRGEPAATYLRTALRRGAACVTANKGPIAFHYPELVTLAGPRGHRLRFEATVLDGTPVFSLVREGLRGCRILRVQGVLNSTVNLLLDTVHRGAPAAEGLREAQRAGIAEADPEMDLAGWDAAAKLSILAQVLAGAAVTPADVQREPLSLQQLDLLPSPGPDRTWRYVAEFSDEESGCASVRLLALPREHPLAAVSGTSGALVLHTDLTSPVIIRQDSPTLTDTAYGVIRDLLELASSPRSRV
ncbi:MAG: homoserine dehydrogenase [Acidobacteriota bacterium]